MNKLLNNHPYTTLLQLPQLTPTYPTMPLYVVTLQRIIYVPVCVNSIMYDHNNITPGMK